MKNVTDSHDGSFSHHDGSSMPPPQVATGAEMLRPLTELSNDDLLRGVSSITFESRLVLARQLAFLAEVERRRLWAKLACTSLHDFCMRRLGMSDYGAYRRMAAAKLALRFPIVLEKVRDGAIHLSALLALRKHMTWENHVELLEAACEKTKREVEDMIAARFPRPDAPSRMWEARVLPGDWLPPEGITSPAFPGGQAPPTCDESMKMEALSPGRHRFEFTGSSELRENLEYARELMRHSNPKGDLGIIVERAMELLVVKLERERFGKTTRPRKTSSKTVDKSDDVDKTLAIGGGEHIPADVRREVAERDDYRCTFVSDDGECCGSQSFLQFDHVIPKARKGETTVANLRLRCKVHNILAAEEILGRDFVQKKIGENQKKAWVNKDGGEVPSLFSREREEQPASEACEGRNLPCEPSQGLVHGGESNVANDPRSKGSGVPIAVMTPHEPMTGHDHTAGAQEAKRRTFETVQSALVNLGFKRKEAIRALDEVSARVDATSPRAGSIEAILLEALAVLT